MVKPANPTIKEEKIETKGPEVVAGIFTTPTYEPINLIMHNLLQNHGKETIFLWLVVGPKHVMGEEGPNYTPPPNMYKLPQERIVDAFTHKPHMGGSDYKKDRFVEIAGKPGPDNH